MAREVLTGQRPLGAGLARLRRSDGTLRPVELRCALHRTPDGASDGLGIFVIDASGREPGPPAPRPALRLTDDATRALVERAAFGIFRCTPDGRLVDVNPALASMLGHAVPERLLGRNLFDELHRGTDHLQRCVDELARGAPEVLCDLHGRQANGVAVHLRLAVTGEFDGTELRFLQGVAENITERARREEIVRRGERMASLTRTLAGVAHEINNPLAAITGFAQILLKREQPDDDRHAHETILQEARRAARIIKDLLTIARRQEGSEWVRVDVNAIVRYLVNTQRYAMDTRGIALELQLATGRPGGARRPGAGGAGDPQPPRQRAPGAGGPDRRAPHRARRRRRPLAPLAPHHHRADAGTIRPHRHRQRSRHPAARPPPHLGSLLDHPRGRRGRRTRAVGGARDRWGARRDDRGSERTRGRHHLHRHAPRRRHAGRRATAPRTGRRRRRDASVRSTFSSSTTSW